MFFFSSAWRGVFVGAQRGTLPPCLQLYIGGERGWPGPEPPKAAAASLGGPKCPSSDHSETQLRLFIFWWRLIAQSKRPLLAQLGLSAPRSRAVSVVNEAGAAALAVPRPSAVPSGPMQQSRGLVSAHPRFAPLLIFLKTNNNLKRLCPRKHKRAADGDGPEEPPPAPVTTNLHQFQRLQERFQTFSRERNRQSDAKPPASRKESANNAHASKLA